MISITGGIKNPTGALLNNLVMTIICVDSPEVVKGAKAVERTNETNTFDFSLYYGTYQITVGKETHPVFYDKTVKVDATAGSSLTITALLNDHIYTVESLLG